MVGAELFFVFVFVVFFLVFFCVCVRSSGRVGKGRMVKTTSSSVHCY